MSPLLSFNMLAYRDPIDRAFDESTLDRLRALKREQDPEGVFRSNHPVG